MEQGMRAIGITESQDFNSGKLAGSQYVSVTVRPSDETRSTSEASFIQRAIKDGITNLKVYTGTMARKIVFDGEKRATGVEVQSVGITYLIRAAKEVILSAGVFQSPQLLMLSGIGPSFTLEQFHIPMLVDLPGVGQNMWDHVFFGPSYRVRVDTFTRLARDPVYLAAQLVKYSVNKQGPLTNNVDDYLGWEKVPDSYLDTFTAEARQDLAGFPDDWPHIEVSPCYSRRISASSGKDTRIFILLT
jgi:choline dehydrogenase